MAHIIISSNSPRQPEQWAAILSTEHRAMVCNDLKKVDRTASVNHTELVVIDAELLGNDFSVLLPLVQRDLKILIIGENWSDDQQIEALAFGCSGYCETKTAERLLPKAVNQLLAGDTWIQRHLIPHLIKKLADLNGNARKQHTQNSDTQKKLATLSHRERDVAERIKAGENNKTIAAALNISERTVKAHLTSIFTKLDISDRLHLALFLKEVDSQE